MSSPTYLTPLNQAGSALAYGEIVRANGNNTCGRAVASSLAGVLGALGPVMAGAAVGVGGPVNVAISGGPVPVLLETGLTPVAGQAVYISASVAGRGTNVAPLVAAPIGVILDASKYASTGRVAVSVEKVIGGAQTTDSPPFITSNEIDLTVPSTDNVLSPVVPAGKFFVIANARFILNLNGTVTTPPTMNCGNDVAKINALASTQQIAAASITSALGNGSPPYLIAANGGVNDLNRPLVDSATSFKWDVTIPATLNSATVMRARLQLFGWWTSST